MHIELLPKQKVINRLVSLIEAGGPEENDYDEVANIWDTLNLEESSSNQKGLTKDEIISLFGIDFLNQTVQGFCFRKPHGYSGDFEVIDYIYQKRITEDSRFKKWDY